VLRVGARPTRRTFITDVRVRASGAFVEVSPLPGEPLVGARALVDFEVDGVPYVAAGPIVGATPGWARIFLSSK
jgi:hypothetical protein